MLQSIHCLIQGDIVSVLSLTGKNSIQLSKFYYSVQWVGVVVEKCRLLDPDCVLIVMKRRSRGHKPKLDYVTVARLPDVRFATVINGLLSTIQRIIYLFYCFHYVC
jgi:hypothetical protein